MAGPAISEKAKAGMNSFGQNLGKGLVNLFSGPLNYQDGKLFIKAGATATDQEIWYMEQLLEGMEGQSYVK